MKAVKRWRYYCDFCKKAGGNKGIIKKHEKGCTKNPHRICGFCGVHFEDTDLLQIIKDNLKYAFTDDDECGGELWTVHNEKEVIGLLREATDSCPACILAAISQCPVPGALFESFNFDEEKEAWWADVNAEQGGYY